MPPAESRSWPRPTVVIQALLTAMTLALAVLLFSDLPNPIPTWPTIGPFPVNPELLVPGALAVVTLTIAVRDGLSIGTVATGILAVCTGFLAAISWYDLFVGPTSGVYWGGFFTLVAGIALSVAIIVQYLARAFGFESLTIHDGESRPHP